MDSNESSRKTFGVGVYFNKNDLETVSNIEIDKSHHVPYPKRVFFIIGNEFCERFNFFGMRTILVLYLKNKLNYTENDATALYHGFTMAIYAMCVFGSVISDVWLGKFKTILYLSIVYSIGSIVIAVSSIPTIDLSADTLLIVGMFLLAIGSGAIKSSVAAFGGDQFKLPEQEIQMATFFSVFYFTISLGSLISTTVTPVLRADVHCFGDQDCFPLAFGVPSILMIVAVVLFFAGRSSYSRSEMPSKNMIVQVIKCITNAISMKIREGRRNPRKNLLDYSIDKYGDRLVNDTRALLRLLLLYVPLPILWALYDQVGSRWTFQASKMNGDIGLYTIKPDQMLMMHSLLFLVFIPIFDAGVYPLLHKIGVRRPLQRIVLGGILASLSFLIAAIVQYKIESSPENSVSMLWLLPQYFTLVMSEVIINVQITIFSYEEAPTSMKSVVQAIWLSTVAGGSLILVATAKLALFQSQAHEFLMFSSLMFVDILMFRALAHNYRSNTEADSEIKCA